MSLNDKLFEVAAELKRYRGVRAVDQVRKQAIADLLVAKFNAEQQMKRIMPQLSETEGVKLQKRWQEKHETLQKGV